MQNVFAELEHLRWQNAVLKEKNWASDNKKLKRSQWFFLVNSRHKPQPMDGSEDYLDALMQDFAVQVKAGEIITMNRKTHAWLPEYIDEVRIKYVVELGKGKLKKDGTKGKSGGTIHLHVYLSVYHHSNISLEWEALRDFFEPPMFQYFALKPFISRPRLVQPDRVEEYMVKSFQRAAWQTIDLV